MLMVAWQVVMVLFPLHRKLGLILAFPTAMLLLLLLLLLTISSMVLLLLFLLLIATPTGPQLLLSYSLVRETTAIPLLTAIPPPCDFRNNHKRQAHRGRAAATRVGNAFLDIVVIRQLAYKYLDNVTLIFLDADNPDGVDECIC